MIYKVKIDLLDKVPVYVEADDQLEALKKAIDDDNGIFRGLRREIVNKMPISIDHISERIVK